MYTQDNILCQFGLINLSSVQQPISQPILIHFWWELYQDGSPYYEYVLLYVNDTLVIREITEKILEEEIGRYFELKEESIGHPTLYLGGRVCKVTIENGIEAWAFSALQYIQAEVKNVEEHLAKRDDGQRS